MILTLPTVVTGHRYTQPVTNPQVKSWVFYVIGDANDSGQPKSGHMANSQAKVCADAIIRYVADATKATGS